MVRVFVRAITSSWGASKTVHVAHASNTAQLLACDGPGIPSTSAALKRAAQCQDAWPSARATHSGGHGFATMGSIFLLYVYAYIYIYIYIFIHLLVHRYLYTYVYK